MDRTIEEGLYDLVIDDIYAGFTVVERKGNLYLMTDEELPVYLDCEDKVIGRSWYNFLDAEIEVMTSSTYRNADFSTVKVVRND